MLQSHLRFLRTAAAVSMLLSGAHAVAAESAAEPLPPPSNNLERMHLKNAKCVWTQEIGNHIYQCLKDNFGMNAHWCHNEAMELYCPKQGEQAQAGGQK